MSDLLENANVIYKYTRQQMIEDGDLIEVPSQLAKQAGFTVPVGILRGVWESCIAWNEKDSKRQTYQDEAGRLWDLLNVLRIKAKVCGGDTILFTLHRIPRGGRKTKPQRIDLKATIGPGDDPSPVITVMLPDQD